ncbi:MAG: hypothetical protein NTY22_07275, partial [Proteobacteria bacterium]|nr:hypothetical protein [Pseudomonadota bacterium]
RIIFLGKLLKHGEADVSQIRLIVKGKIRWLLQGEREPCEVIGNIYDLKSKVWHNDRRDIHVWIDKHNKYSTTGAMDLFNRKIKKENEDVIGSLKHKLWDQLPLFIRPFLYFLYRYLIRLGFLDGVGGFVYAFLQAFWFRLLIDAKYYEMRLNYRKELSNKRNC